MNNQRYFLGCDCFPKFHKENALWSTFKFRPWRMGRVLKFSLAGQSFYSQEFPSEKIGMLNIVPFAVSKTKVNPNRRVLLHNLFYQIKIGLDSHELNIYQEFFAFILLWTDPIRKLVHLQCNKCRDIRRLKHVLPCFLLLSLDKRSLCLVLLQFCGISKRNSLIKEFVEIKMVLW